MMEMGKQTNQFFDSFMDVYGRKKWRLKSLEQYSREHNTNEQPGKQYFKATTLPEIVNTAPMPQFKSGRHSTEMEKGLYIPCTSESFDELMLISFRDVILKN
jgi:dual specificity protein kinase YAK1